jgi:hypothetical protein
VRDRSSTEKERGSREATQRGIFGERSTSQRRTREREIPGTRKRGQARKREAREREKPSTKPHTSSRHSVGARRRSNIERQLLVAALMQATTVDCLGHTTTDDGSSVGNFENIVPAYDIFSFSEPSMEQLIGSQCPFLYLPLSTLKQYGFGKGVMGVIAVPTDVPYHVQEEHHYLQ